MKTGFGARVLVDAVKDAVGKQVIVIDRGTGDNCSLTNAAELVQYNLSVSLGIRDADAWRWLYIGSDGVISEFKVTSQGGVFAGVGCSKREEVFNSLDQYDKAPRVTTIY
jgi:hypothetical protein